MTAHPQGLHLGSHRGEPWRYRRDANGHLPPRRHAKSRRAKLGRRAFGKTSASRAAQIANLVIGHSEHLTRRSVLRRRNRRTHGRRALPLLALALVNPDHLCAMPCQVPVGVPRPQACQEHLMQRGATYVCPYYVSGRCGFRSGSHDCFLQPGAPAAPNHEKFEALTEARKKFARALSFKRNNYSIGLRSKALTKYLKQLREIRPLLRGVPACRFVLELGRAQNAVDMNFVDRDVFCAVVRGDLPRRGSREARAAQVLDEALELWRAEGGDLGEIIDRVASERFLGPPITPSIPALRDPTAGLAY